MRFTKLYDHNQRAAGQFVRNPEVNSHQFSFSESIPSIGYNHHHWAGFCITTSVAQIIVDVYECLRISLVWTIVAKESRSPQSSAFQAALINEMSLLIASCLKLEFPYTETNSLQEFQ